MIKGIDDFALIVSSEKSIDFYKKIGFMELLEKKEGMTQLYCWMLIV